MYTIITNCSDSYYLIILDVPQNMGSVVQWNRKVV